MKRRLVAVLLLSTLAGLGVAPAVAQDPEPSVAVDRIAFGELPSIAVPLDGFMWVLDRRGAAIGKIDPDTNELVDVIDLPELVEGTRSAWDLEAARGSLWLTIPSKKRIAEIDPDTHEVRSLLRTRGFVSNVDSARGSLWFVRGTERRTVLVRVDPASRKTVATFRLGGHNTGVGGLTAF
ncbi:MAG TPA: hypothetical protein VEV43_15175, partial [Actinomycetota bacterium]|nr:hypothetical protein [Actinomycetota bacterium]